MRERELAALLQRGREREPDRREKRQEGCHAVENLAAGVAAASPVSGEAASRPAGDDRDVATDEHPIGESRWPPALVVLGFMFVNVAVRIWFPREGVLQVPWLAPLLEAALVVVLVTANPSGPAERTRLRGITIVLVGLLVLASLWATALLIHDLITGEGIANDPDELLASGALVWVGNNLVFGVVYWLMDGGGPIARTRLTVPVDFAFTQHINPEMGPGWRPVFLDYLHLGFTNATAFSPTDVMPLTHRAKYAMLVQATIALALFALVVARAVNAFQ